MDFFATTEVVNRRYNKGLKLLIGLICAADIFVLLIEFVSNGIVGIVFVVPLFFIIPAFMKMGEKTYMSDILCNITESESEFILVMSNVLIDKKDVLSRKYLVKKENLQILTDQKKFNIALVGDGIVNLFGKDDIVVYEKKFTSETIELNLKKTTFNDLQSFFSGYLK